MIFLASELSDGHRYARDFDAADWSEARRICEDNGWTLDGVLRYTIPASAAFGPAEADEIVAAMNEAQDWMKQ